MNESTCPHCQAELPLVRDAFCWECGNELPEALVNAVEASPGPIQADHTHVTSPNWSEPLVALLVLGGVGTAWFLVVQPVLYAHATSNWPPTYGTVIRSSHTTSFIRYKGGGSTKLWHPRIEYSYTIPGSERVYTSSKVSANGIDFRWTGNEDVEHFLAQYHAGMTIKVYYNPLDPGDTVLFPGIWEDSSLPTLKMAVTALVVFLSGCLICWWNVGRAQNKETSTATGNAVCPLRQPRT